MSSNNNIFPSVPADIPPEQSCGDVNGNVVAGTDWYNPDPFAYQQPYLTPIPSSTVEPQQWTQYARMSSPNISMAPYTMAQPPNAYQAPLQPAPGRPRSSPSTFGTSPENINWGPSAGLGIDYTTGAPHPTSMTSTFPPTAFQTYAAEDFFETPSPPQLQQPQPRRTYQPIAPNPTPIPSASAPKRPREEDATLKVEPGSSSPDPTSNKRKRRRTNSATPIATKNLSEDETYLLHLKQTEDLPWKDIVARFKDDRGKVYTEAALQMKNTRMRQRSRPWEEQDVYALEEACKWWEKKKWRFISEKMLEYGIIGQWPAKDCERKWREMSLPAMTAPVTTTAGVVPVAAQFSSPPNSSLSYSWVPYQ